MRKIFFRNLPAYQFHLLQKFSDQIDHAIFTREGGISKKPFDSLNVRFGIGDDHEGVARNRFFVCNALDIKPELLISADQTHSKNVQIIDEEFLRYRRKSEEIAGFDAFVTDLDHVALMIQVADCQALLMYEPSKRVVAAIHAGWKGLSQDISGETISVLQSHYGVDPRNLIVCIAPSLGPCCSFFSNPESELPASFTPYIDVKKRVDLWSYSLAQLERHGIQKRNMELAKICTQCDRQKRFFSFRSEHGITGRFGVVIALRD